MGQAARQRIKEEFPLARAIDAHLGLYRELRESTRARVGDRL